MPRVARWGAVLRWCAALALAGAAPAAAQELAAHYTFDEGQGAIARDATGRGSDGKIHGALYVPSPRGHALRFDGQDDFVSLGRRPALQITGDFTLEAWVKTHARGPSGKQPLKKHRLLVGSAGEASIERNYNLRINHHDDLCCEWADGQGAYWVTDPAPFLDGSWRHLAAVVEATGRYCLYVDGRLHSMRAIDQPVPRPTPVDIHIGGWSYGHFEGEIDEVRIYRGALSAQQIWAHSGGKPEACPSLLDLHAGYTYAQKGFAADLFLSGAGDGPAAVRLQALDPGGRRLGEEARVPLGRETRPGSGRWVAQGFLPAANVPPGEYRVEASLLNARGRSLARAEKVVACTTPPEWLGSKVGITDRVLPLFMPCRAVRREGGWQVETWGRSHRFGASPLLDGIESADAPLLAGPIRFACAADGSPVAWNGRPPELKSASPAGVRLSHSLEGGPLRLVLSTHLEYDGFLRVDWSVQAARAAALDSLAIEIPVRAEHAGLFYAWPSRRSLFLSPAHSGLRPEEWASGFKPLLWIGSEERGLCWVADSDEGWLPAASERAVEVRRDGEVVTLRLNVVGERVRLRRGERRAYTFGLQATPVRPQPETCWDTRVVRQPPYAHEYEWPERKIGGKPALAHYAGAGVRGLNVWRWWDAFSYTLPLGHEKEFPGLVRACHAQGLKVVPYTIGFLLSEKAPEHRFFHKEMLSEPIRPYPVDTLPGLEKQMTWYTCRKGPYQDFAMASIDRCMAEYGIDGVYLDGTTSIPLCANRSHGCGYVRPDGSIAPTYAVFATREFMKRLYTVVKSHKPDGIVDAHVSACMNVPAFAFTTGCWGGEDLSQPDPKGFLTDVLPLDRFRTEFMGHNVGAAADFLYYRLGKYRACTGLALLHDVPVRSEKESDLALLSSLWRAREAFGCKDAEFVGYWKSAPLVTVSPEGCRASLWRHPRSGVLAVIANITREPTEVTAHFSLDALGLQGRINARDALTGASLPIDAGRLSLSLPSQDWRLVHIRSGASEP